MTGAVNNIGASASGNPLKVAQQRQAKRRELKGTNAGRDIRDEYDPTVTQTEEVDAVRSTEHSTHEEALEDRQTHEDGRVYGPKGRVKPKPELDLNA